MLVHSLLVKLRRGAARRTPAAWLRRRHRSAMRWCPTVRHPDRPSRTPSCLPRLRPRASRPCPRGKVCDPALASLRTAKNILRDEPFYRRKGIYCTSLNDGGCVCHVDEVCDSALASLSTANTFCAKTFAWISSWLGFSLTVSLSGCTSRSAFRYTRRTAASS
jgi:hypothetical protein